MYAARVATLPADDAAMAAAACVETNAVALMSVANPNAEENNIAAINASRCPVRFTTASLSAITYDVAAPTKNAKTN